MRGWRFSVSRWEGNGSELQGWAKVGVQVWVHEREFIPALFINHCIVFLAVSCKPFAHPLYVGSQGLCCRWLDPPLTSVAEHYVREDWGARPRAGPASSLEISGIFLEKSTQATGRGLNKRGVFRGEKPSDTAQALGSWFWSDRQESAVCSSDTEKASGKYLGWRKAFQSASLKGGRVSFLTLAGVTRVELCHLSVSVTSPLQWGDKTYVTCS